MLVDNIALPLAHRHDKDEELMVTHLVDQTVPGVAHGEPIAMRRSPVSHQEPHPPTEVVNHQES